MSRRFQALVVFVAAVWLSSCGEESPEAESPGEVEIIAQVEISRMGSEETINWNRELALLSNPSLYEEAATDANTDAASLDEATNLELDPELKVVRITATHQDGEVAKRYAEALASALGLLRLRSEMELGAPEIEEGGPLESDRMTYEKARKLLEEEAADQEGVIYRKED